MASSSKGPIQEVQNKVDVLATSIEVINQKLAQQLNPIAKTDPVLLRQISTLDQKLSFLYTTLKKHIEESQAKNNTIQTSKQEPITFDTTKLENDIAQTQEEVKNIKKEVQGTHDMVQQLLNVHAEQVKVFIEQNRTLNEHIESINERISSLITTDKKVIRSFATSIHDDVAIAKKETEKIKNSRSSRTTKKKK